MLKPHVFLGLLCSLALFGVSREGHAVHKNWLLKNAGSQCAFNVPNASLDTYYGYSLQNGGTSTRSVSCPISLSSRWGSSTPSTPVPRWAGAWGAVVYVNNNKPGTSFSCTAKAQFASGVIRYSRTVSTTAGGNQKLAPAYDGDWGGTLETYESDAVLFMHFQCSVPGNDSAIQAYRVRICQNTSSSNTDCGDGGDGDDAHDLNPAGINWVQVSGHECMADNNNSATRGGTGIKNIGTQDVAVYCPITPAAEDTEEAIRDVLSTHAYYTPGSSGAAPLCQLTWNDRWSGTPTEHWSAAFTPYNFPRRVSLGSVNTRLDTGMAVYCLLPPGATLKGITSEMTVAAVNGGG